MMVARIDQTTARPVDSLDGYCTATALEPGVDIASYEWKWTRNGAIISTGTSSSGGTSGVELLLSTLNKPLTALADYVFQCSATDDGGNPALSFASSSPLTVTTMSGATSCQITGCVDLTQSPYLAKDISFISSYECMFGSWYNVNGYESCNSYYASTYSRPWTIHLPQYGRQCSGCDSAYSYCEGVYNTYPYNYCWGGCTGCLDNLVQVNGCPAYSCSGVTTGPYFGKEMGYFSSDYCEFGSWSDTDGYEQCNTYYSRPWGIQLKEYGRQCWGCDSTYSTCDVVYENGNYLCSGGTCTGCLQNLVLQGCTAPSCTGYTTTSPLLGLPLTYAGTDYCYFEEYSPSYVEEMCSPWYGKPWYFSDYYSIQRYCYDCSDTYTDCGYAYDYYTSSSWSGDCFQ